MKNISFDNPYLLLVAIPVLLLLIIPYIIAIRKENRSKAVVVSFVIHILIVVLVTLAAAGTVVTTIMTETHVYVVADVSYSANRNLDAMDATIAELQEKLPKNSKVGVVCFGKDYTLHTEMGADIQSVKEAQVDDSATNISAALNYVADLFEENVIKRVVLITDGKETDTNATAELISAVENLNAKHIYIDAIYMDDNLPDDAKEVQVSGVDVTHATYLNHQTTATVMLQSSYDADVIVYLYQGENTSPVSTYATTLTKGYNIINFDLDTSVEGEFDYKVEVEATEDYSPHNNAYTFTQSVTGKLSVLLVSSSEADLTRAQALYGANATIDAYINNPAVPCTIEDMCKYDEIIISGVDVRTLHNYTAFVDAVDKAVSLFGKSLITMGDLMLQNKTDDVLKQLEDMLPVKYGNSDQDAKIYGIVLDTSHSMLNAGKLALAKQAAIYLLNLLDDNDYVTVIAFNGDVTVMQAPTKALNREEIAKTINEIETRQGTYIGLGLRTAFELMISQAQTEKQVMLITDGLSFSVETDAPHEIAFEMRNMGIYTSVITTVSTLGAEAMQRVASSGGGHFYPIEKESQLEELMFTQIADDLTESIIEKESPVMVKNPNDAVMSGIESLPHLQGFVYAKEKASATTVLQTEYQKAEGGKANPPVYVYWSYGNGRVCTFTGSLTGDWVAGWESGEGNQFLQNVFSVNTPKERIDYPYTLDITYDGTYSNVEITPATLNPYATTHVTLTLPDGSQTTQQLAFDSKRYTYSFQTPDIGKYEITIVYAYDNKSFEASTGFHISYSPEYDAFAIFDAASLHESIRNRGSVSEGVVPTIQNNEKEVATYTIAFAIPFLIAAVALFAIDVFIRKIKWKDIQSLFGHKA